MSTFDSGFFSSERETFCKRGGTHQTNAFAIGVLDLSGTLNSNLELEQLTINLTFNLRKLYPDQKFPLRHEINALIADMDPLDDGNAWSVDDFKAWYIGTVLI